MFRTILFSIATPAFPVLASLVLCASASAGTLHVDSQLTTGANDGSSWANAFQTSDGLQLALAVAVAGDDIFVADGTYLATQVGTRSASFQLLNGVTLYGGFLGGESSPTERPPLGSAPSILSGDLAGNDGAGTLGDNSFHVIRTVGTNATAVLDGFDVQGGNANGGGSNNDRGGGILCVGSVSPTVRNCRFLNNRSSFGGAAGYCNNGAAPTFTDCTFENGVGGSFGGAFDIAGGGAVRYERCLFRNNTAARAGALEVFATTGVVVNNCVFFDNTATGSNGGGAIWVGSGGNTLFRGCTIAGNTSTNHQVAGLRNQGAAGTTVENCILFGNSGPGGAHGTANQVNAATVVTWSLVAGGFAGVGNLSGDPQFVDLFGGDLRLTLASPAIDAGNNGGVPVGFDLDIAQNPRFADISSVVDVGSGSAPVVDMGAYELPPEAFTTVPGCFGNAVTLVATTSNLTIGQPLGLSGTSPAAISGIALFYAGPQSTDAAGCGLALPGLGELMLAIAPAPILMGTASITAGVSNFTFNVPNLPSLVGLSFGLQGAHADLVTPGAPVELSNLLTTTVLP